MKACCRPALIVPFLLFLCTTPVAKGQTGEPLPPGLETDLALSALPPHLRDEAGVFLLGKDGLERSRESANGFECLVRTHGAVPGAFSDSLAPVCYDRNGAETLLPAVIDEVAMLQRGMAPADVRSRIDARWEAGAYTLPKPGVAYMLSPVFCINGACDLYVPHVMFYAPNAHDEDVGSDGDRLSYVPFIQSPGRPSAVMVVPVGVQERSEIRAAESDLMQRAESWWAHRRTGQ